MGLALGEGQSADTCEPGRLQPHGAGDDHPHDLAGATVDPADARIGIRTGDRVFEHVSVSSVQLHASVYYVALHFGTEQLDCSGVGRREVTAVDRLKCGVEQARPASTSTLQLASSNLVF